MPKNLPGLPASDLSPREQELFTIPPAGLLFEVNAGSTALEIALGARKPGFSGDVLVEVVANKDRMRENFILRLTPESAGIDRVIVQLSQAARFRLAGRSHPRTTSRYRSGNGRKASKRVRVWAQAAKSGN